MGPDMRNIVLAMVFVLCATPQFARAQDSSAQIQSVITEQIEAFRADDLGKAFSFASPKIRSMFGDPDTFGQMVRNGYPMVWHPADLRFSTLSDRGGKTVQSVLVTDQAGSLHFLDYEMIPGEAGWQIDGVTIRRAGAAGA